MSLFPKFIFNSDPPAKPAKPAKPEPSNRRTLATLATLAGGETSENINQPPVEPFPEWQRDLCEAHADFNNWRGQCPVSLDDCLISKVIESGGNLDQLRGLNLGHGITTDAVIDLWLETGEPAKDLINDPAWFVCMAEYLVAAAAHQI